MLNSNQLYAIAQTLMPGGVNSPVRSFKGVDATPVFFEQGKGAHMVDVEGKTYIDYVCSWGALILGHAHPTVVEAIKNIADKGISFGTPTPLEIELANKIISLMPSIEKIRMTNSGTEATMTAIRLARAFTGRDKIIKFNGCYHGHSDSLLSKAGSGTLTLGLPSCPGIPTDITQHTLTVDYNNYSQVEQLFEHYEKEIAAIIIEPIAANMGLVEPTGQFLQKLQDICNREGALLIFDEVITGFRVGLGGAQAYYGVKPDLTTLGKIIGGGLPIGALGGRADIMNLLAPVGPVYHAGTLSGNPLAMGAGLATLTELEASGVYDRLSLLATELMSGLKTLAHDHNIPLNARSVGGLFGFNFTQKNQILTFDDIQSSDERLFKQFYHGMLAQGVYLAPSMYEVGFISIAHTPDIINQSLDAANVVLKNIASLSSLRN